MEEKLQNLSLAEIIDIYNNLFEMEQFLDKQEKLLTSTEENND